MILSSVDRVDSDLIRRFFFSIRFCSFCCFFIAHFIVLFFFLISSLFVISFVIFLMNFMHGQRNPWFFDAFMIVANESESQEHIEFIRWQTNDINVCFYSKISETFLATFVISSGKMFPRFDLYRLVKLCAILLKIYKGKKRNNKSVTMWSSDDYRLSFFFRHHLAFWMSICWKWSSPDWSR